MPHRVVSFLALIAFSTAHIEGQSSFEGVYSGAFSGANVGKFVATVQPDSTVIIWGYDETWDTGLRNVLNVSDEGTFSGIVGVTLVNGSVNGERVSGSGTNSGGSVSFSGNRKPDTGPVNHFVGCYAGLGISNVSSQIQIEAIIAADGAAWFYSRGNDFQNGGEGILNADGSFSVTDVGGITYTGSISDNDFSISGNFSGGGESGTFSLARKTNFLPLLQPTQLEAIITSDVANRLQVQINTQERRSYSIYRGTSLSTLQLIETLRGSGTALLFSTQLNNGETFYRVEAR